MILDNAHSADQVRPLLAGAAGGAVVVTSRNRLSGLVAAEGARPIVLDVLAPPEARLLLQRRLGQRRVEAQPDAADQLAQRCAHLPLALAIVAGHAVLREGLPLLALAEQLSDAGGRMRVLAGGDDATTDLRAVFSWSYRQLDTRTARLFRLLGLHPGIDITVPATASLAGLRPATARTILAGLADAHLLSEHTPGRFRLHDLLRAYAGELVAGDPERSVARTRLLDHYLHTAHAADRLLEPHRDPIEASPPVAGARPEALADEHAALDWYEAEHSNLLAVIRGAAQAGADEHVWRLAWTLYHHLDRRGHWHDWAALMEQAVDAAGRLGDAAGEARARRSLGGAHLRLGRLERSRRELVRSLDLYRRLHDEAGQGAVLYNLSIVFDSMGEPEKALQHGELALTLSPALSPAVRAHVRNAIGWYHTRLGDHDAALAQCRAALQVFEALGDGSGQANTLDSMGLACLNMGRHGDATEHYTRALALYRDLGDRFEQADTLDHLGDTAAAAGDRSRAEEHWRAACQILGELNNPAAATVRAKLDRGTTR